MLLYPLSITHADGKVKEKADKNRRFRAENCKSFVTAEGVPRAAGGFPEKREIFPCGRRGFALSMQKNAPREAERFLCFERIDYLS